MAIYSFLFLSVLGFLDSAFLTVQHYSRNPLECPMFGGCDVVTTSAYSEVFGIPIALFGGGYYLFIFLGSLYAYLSENHKAFYALCHVTIIGFITSILLVSIMFFALNALCFYCLLSAASSTLLFIIGVHTIKKEGGFFKFM